MDFNIMASDASLCNLARSKISIYLYKKNTNTEHSAVPKKC